MKVVNLRYSMPVTIDAGNFPNLLLAMTAVSGAASAQHGGSSCSWRSGETMLFSPGRNTMLDFDRDFSQSSLRIDIDRIESICGGLLGHPLERCIQFVQKPFSPSFNHVWSDALKMVVSLGDAGGQLSYQAEDSLQEFVSSLLLHGHQHSYSEELSRPVRSASHRLVNAAEQLFREHAANGVTVSCVARQLGISVRSLQMGFHDARGVTPSEYLRKIRLEAARHEFTSGCGGKSVTDVAMELGFLHASRFSAAYKAAFGESPIVTLRRCRQR